MIAEGPQGLDPRFYDEKGKLRDQGIRDVERSSQEAANRARADRAAANFETGKDKPKIGSGYDSSTTRRNIQLAKQAQVDSQIQGRSTSRTAAAMGDAADAAAQLAKKAGAFALKRAVPVVGAALTGYEIGKNLNNKFKISDKILDATMKEQILDRIYNILEEKFAILKEHLMLEANRNVIKQGRSKIIKARVRGGKIQRRKKLSAVKGFTIRKGKLVRMSPAEKRRRKMGARRAKLKRRGKMARALMKRKRSLRKRAAIGLK